jgi:hypothetical protein
MIRSVLSFNGRLVIAMLATFAALVAISPSVAQAHDTTGVPYHTGPTLSAVYRDAGGNCIYYLHSPSVVLGFKDEYVGWRPVAAYQANGTWNYRWGDIKVAHVDASRMISGWMNPNLTFSNGDTYVIVPPGTNRWFGFQILYGSTTYTHFEWMAGGINC